MFSMGGYPHQTKQHFLSRVKKSLFLFEFNTSSTLQGILYRTASVEMNEKVVYIGQKIKALFIYVPH